jgi:hypothetical protein
MNRLNTRVILSIASFPLVLLTISSALAQAQDEATEEIVVVGTRGEARDPLKSAVPVDLISADEIAAAHSHRHSVFPGSPIRAWEITYEQRNFAV